MQDALKAVLRIPYVSVAFFPSLKQTFIAYHSSKVSSCPDCIFEIHQLWQSGFSRVYSNCCCSCSFEPEITKFDLSSHKMYSNNILNFQESMPILNACTKNVWKLIEGTMYLKTNPKNLLSIDIFVHINIYIYGEREREIDRTERQKLSDRERRRKRDWERERQKVRERERERVWERNEIRRNFRQMDCLMQVFQVRNTELKFQPIYVYIYMERERER